MAAPTVYEYEIEFVVKDRITGKEETRTSTEYAYTMTDALYQASLTIDQTIGEMTKIVKIGPPKRLIDTIVRETQAMIQNALHRFEKP